MAGGIGADLQRAQPVAVDLPELIQAPPGPYKVKPPNPGGLDIAGESETAFETSAGEDKDAQLDLSKVPETAVAKPKPEPKPAPAAETKTPPAQAAAAPEPKPSGPAGSVIQLGAFANQAQAERAWSALSARFPSIAAMNKLVVPFSGGIRLRAGSRRATAGKAEVIMDVNANAVAAALREHRVTRLIHGHTHRPARHEHVVDSRPCERYVLADWYDAGSYLRVDASGCEPVMLA